MHVYKLPTIHFHHVHKDNDEFTMVNDRFMKQFRMTRYMLLYHIRLVVLVIRRELKQRGGIILCYELDPYHYVLSRTPFSGYEIPEDRHDWYHLLYGMVKGK